MKYILTMILTYLFLFLSLGNDFACAKDLTSMLDLPSTTAGVDVAGAILQRNIDGDLVLQRAAAIFKDRLSDSTPLQDAALDLLRTCKASKNDKDRKLAKDVEGKAKQIYGIRAALIDLDSASVTAPRACAVLTEPTERGWFTTSRSSLSDPANLPSTKELESCIKGLFQIDNSWTSFTSHRQDASALCEVPGTENAARMIMELLNDINAVIPDWIGLFKAEQEAHVTQMEARQRFLQEIHSMEQQHKTDLTQEREAARAKMVELERIWRSHVDKMDQHSREQMTDLTAQVGQMHKDLAGYTENFAATQGEHESLLGIYHAAVIEFLRLQQDGVQDINSAVKSLVASYKDANGDVLTQHDLYTKSMDLALREADTRQARLIQSQLELAEIQEANIERQKETLAFTKQTESLIADIAGNIEDLRGMLTSAVSVFAAVWSGHLWLVLTFSTLCTAIALGLAVLGRLRYAVMVILFCVISLTARKLFVELQAMAQINLPAEISYAQLRYTTSLLFSLIVMLTSIYYSHQMLVFVIGLTYHIIHDCCTWERSDDRVSDSISEVGSETEYETRFEPTAGCRRSKEHFLGRLDGQYNTSRRGQRAQTEPPGRSGEL